MTSERRQILIVGGGTAGWLTAGYLARALGADLPGGVAITLVESTDIGILGVGEGTFPTIRRTLARIGIREVDLIRRCGATFKQGATFIDWVESRGRATRNQYLHAFQAPAEDGPELLPYWLLGLAGDMAWDEASTPQKRATDAGRAPKLPSHPDFAGPLNYAYHFDAAALAVLLREQAVANGVRRMIGTIDHVTLGEDDSISAVHSVEHGALTADLYIDCTGFRAELIGKAMGRAWRSCRTTLFCDSAVALQIPYARPDAPIASSTLSTAQRFGWIWDIGLADRRGTGHVYSSAHGGADEAEAILRRHIGAGAEALEARHFRFDAGYREVSWYRNCVAVGLSSGFFEPLEATGIVLSEVAAGLIANLFPWAGDSETSARQFNRIMSARYERVLDFIKLHYWLSRRTDGSFWTDNRDPASAPESLLERLDRWRFRPPNELDVDANIDIFPAASWQYVLYGMGWRTDLSARAGAYRLADAARAAFAQVRTDADFAERHLPANRDLVRHAGRGTFGQAAA